MTAKLRVENTDRTGLLLPSQLFYPILHLHTLQLTGRTQTAQVSGHWSVPHSILRRYAARKPRKWWHMAALTWQLDTTALQSECYST